MRCILTGTTAALAALALSGTAHADSHTGAGYTAADLLSPCQESDNDARWGEAAETECEQYILGFVGALAVDGSDTGICPPETNTADEIRWVFMRWVHGSYTERTKMPAPDALLAALQEGFPCAAASQ